jgi:hypothetical protein
MGTCRSGEEIRLERYIRDTSELLPNSIHRQIHHGMVLDNDDYSILDEQLVEDFEVPIVDAAGKSL